MKKNNFEVAEDIMVLGEISVDSLVERYGSPLYIYDEKIIKDRLDLLKYNFQGFDIFYSFKSNPNPNICRFIKKQGHCADAASIGEVHLAEDCGFTKHEIIYSAPGKRKVEIEEALGKCIIIADSLNELNMINEICRDKGIVEDVGIRINPDYSIGNSSALEVMSGFPSKFGIDEEEIRRSYERIKGLPNVKIKGIQIYMGSQIMDYNVIYNNFMNIFKIAAYLKQELDFGLEFIDFGGGFGIQYANDAEELNIKKAGQMVAELRKSEEFKEISHLRLIIESGRFICGPAGFYVARVLDTKISRGKRYAIIEGGMNTFFRPVFMKENRYPIYAANKMGGHDMERITLGGVMCTPIDIFEEDIELPHLEKGDIIVFGDTGAYGYTMSLTKFISHGEAKEIYIEMDKNILK